MCVNRATPTSVTGELSFCVGGVELTHHYSYLYFCIIFGIQKRKDAKIPKLYDKKPRTVDHLARGSTKNAANCASLCKMQITRTSTCRTHIAGPKPWRFGSRTSEGRYRLEHQSVRVRPDSLARAALHLCVRPRLESAVSSASLRGLGLHGSSSPAALSLSPEGGGAVDGVS